MKFKYEKYFSKYLFLITRFYKLLRINKMFFFNIDIELA